MVAPPVHGALAPDSRTLPARPKPEAIRDLPPSLRREREKTWQDEVRERVRKRKRTRSGEPDLPLFESREVREPIPLSDRPPPEAPAAPAASGRRVEPPSRPLPAAAPIEAAPSALEEPAPGITDDRGPRPDERSRSFESRVLERVDPLDSLADLPLRAEASLAGSPNPELPTTMVELDGPREAPPPVPESSGDEGWTADAPLEPRLDPPRLVDERPVERPAQALERAQAAAVDAVLLGGIGVIVVYFASRFAHVPLDGLRPTWPYLSSFLGFLGLAYAVYFTGTTGQTLGKLVYGLRVVDTAGRPPGYLRTAGRAALGALSIAVLGLGLVPVLFDPARRAFHDRVLRTRVIRG